MHFSACMSYRNTMERCKMIVCSTGMRKVTIEQPTPLQPPTESVSTAVSIPGCGDGPVQVRPMNVNDAEIVAKLLTESFRSKFVAAIGEKRLEGKVRALTDEYRRATEKHARTLVAVCQGRPVGVAVIKFHGDAFEDTAPFCSEIGCWGAIRMACVGCVLGEMPSSVDVCYLDAICVDDKYRGRGIGGLLLQRIEYEARQKECKVVTLWVQAENKAETLYEREGYVVVAEEDGICLTSCTVGFRHWKKMSKDI